MRTHLVLPDDLVKDLDELVGKRGRSRFIAEATREKMRRERLRRVLDETAGTLDLSRHPEWATDEGVAAWIRALRDTPSIREETVGEVSDRLKRSHRLAEGKASRSRSVP